jgi:Methyltransferase domain
VIILIEKISCECPILGKPMQPVFSETVLGKYLATYYYCEDSGILKTETPYWLNEAYQDAIADTDTGIAMRNIAVSSFLERILYHLFSQQSQFLDVSGGYGLLTRLLRDKGFDCYTTDKYCKNLFAQAFEPAPGFKADALFAFEVLEHLEDPLQFLKEIFAKYDCKTLIFSTLTFSQIPPKDWYYYSFETGQHITFYQPRTLALLAEAFGCHYYMISADMHMITDINLSSVDQLLLFNPYLRKLYTLYVRWKRKGLSRNWDDYLLLKERAKLRS